ncbi:phage antirepressor Ant [Vibrio albus]|uniref:Phage antirepressor Ant n=2 Tax=Vibrio albus TaxID=2200953 RepID=A0A2U3B624_9VIBR|nr:phage antirepressor Ant [Vibrio albus]
MEVFNHPQFGDLTVLTDADGDPWFFAQDVASMLGYQNTRDAISKHVDNEDKDVANRDTNNKGLRKLTTINESGLYSLIFSSKLESAKAFKRWVTKEVLPSIRKHGGYTMGQEDMTPDDLMAKAVLVAQSKIQEQEQENRRLEQVQRDLINQFAAGMTIPAFCMQLNGVNTQEVQGFLVRKGILIREKHGYRPSSPHRNKEFECTTHEYRPGKRSYKTLVTQLGGAMLYKFYHKGMLPMRKDWNGSYTTSQSSPEELAKLHQ